jgi:hypothetical protein
MEKSEPPATSSNQADPPTANQEGVLRFFIGDQHGIRTFAEASKTIDAILGDPRNRARWDAHNASVPATQPQRARLKWAAARLGKRLPANLNKARAHELLDEWFDDDLDLEGEWREEKERKIESEMEIECICGDVDDWREFYGCKKVSQKRVKGVLAVIGSRNDGEPLDKFMDRFFDELCHQVPTLFSARKVATRQSPSSKPNDDSLAVVLVIIVVVLGILGALAGRFLFN